MYFRQLHGTKTCYALGWGVAPSMSVMYCPATISLTLPMAFVFGGCFSVSWTVMSLKSMLAKLSLDDLFLYVSRYQKQQ